MRGLALEGGGARGAYHIGVVKAYLEAGYEFDGFVGTSIGAINAAMLAQGDFDKAMELWENISMEQIFYPDEKYIFHLTDLFSTGGNKESLPKIKKAFAEIIRGKGVNTSKIKTFLDSYIDESKIRSSGKDFGLVTVSLDELKPYELMLEDIPQGKLVSYIMASASLPGFHPETIDGIRFLDGGFYNSCPANLLIDRGYSEVVAVRTNALGVFRKIDGEANVKIVTPRKSLGNVLSFSKESCVANIGYGYHDGLCSLKS